MSKSSQTHEKFDLNLLLLFRAILETHSISKAATRLRITQPAASNGLRRLRDAIGDEMFVPGASGMMATDFAAQWALEVIPALERIEGAAFATTTFDPALWSGIIRLGVTDYLIETLLYRVLPNLIAKAPHGQFRLIPMSEREPHDDLSNGTLDLALGSFHKVRPNFYQRKLSTETFVMIMRRDHPLAKAKWTIEQYANAAHLLIAPWGQPLGIVDEVLTAEKLSRTIALTVPYFNAAPALVERSDLISTVPLQIAEIWRARHKIVIVKPPIEIPHFSLHMLWAERSKQNPVHEWVRSEILALAKSETE